MTIVRVQEKRQGLEMKEKLKAMLAELRAERDRLDEAITALEAVAEDKASSGRTRKVRSTGVGGVSGAGRGHSKRAKQGLLRETMRKVLSSARKPISAGELRDAVMEAGYPTKSPKSLYTALYATADKDPMIVRDSAGFSLGKAPAKGKSKAKKKAVKKRGKRKAAKRPRKKAAKPKK